MAFKARFDGNSLCPKCKSGISAGDLVQYADSDQQVLEHTDCDGDTTTPEDLRVVRWENLTEESLDRIELLDQELARVAPLAKQGKCPSCHIELPKSRVCGYCS